MSIDKPVLMPCPAITSFQTLGLFFKQQRDMLVLQLEHEKIKHELEIKKQIEVERMCHDLEREKLDLEKSWLAMIRDGTLASGVRGRKGSSVPRFDEKKKTSKQPAMQLTTAHQRLHF